MKCRMDSEHTDAFEAHECDIGSMMHACIQRLERIRNCHSDRWTRERANQEIWLREDLVREATE